MPRQVHGRPPSTSGPSQPAKRQPARSRNLNAFAIAQQDEPSKIRVRPNRLGEIGEIAQETPRFAKGDQSGTGRPVKRRKLYGTDRSANEDNSGGESDVEEWHLGVDDDDTDSDLDSEMAMGESDEERFEGFTFRGSSSHSSKRPKRANDPDKTNLNNVNLQESSRKDARLGLEDQSADEDDLGEDVVDLATALDMNKEDENEGENLQQKRSRPTEGRLSETQNIADISGVSGDEASTSGDAHSLLSFSDDEDSAANHARLKTFVQGLKGRELSDIGSKRPRPPGTAGEPSDYGLASSKKLTIADLLATVTDPQLKESLKMLHNSDQNGPKTSTKGIPGKLDPPLPKRQQDRRDREAAYEKSKETLSRWIDTVKRNRRAEHIAFPLSDHDTFAALGTNHLMPISQSEAVTPLESAIHSILHESGLTSGEDQIQAFEDLQEKKKPVEEVQSRRAELRKARELMFREEIRGRRIKKIKSKAYRRVHRRERDKRTQEERAALAAAGALDSEDRLSRQDRQRAEERMGARHKESKWAKEIKATGRAAWDEDARLGVHDLARKDEELRKRIEGKEANRSDGSVGDTSDEESADEISIDEYDEVEGLRLTQRLEELETLGGASSQGSRLSSMPFMRKAESARQAVNEAEIEETRRMLASEGGKAANDEPTPAKIGGRRRFGSGQQPQTERATRADKKNEFEEGSDDETGYRSLTVEKPLDLTKDRSLQKGACLGKLTIKQSDGQTKGQDLAGDTSNPWLHGPRNRKPGLTTDEAIISTNTPMNDRNEPPKGSGSRQSTAKTKAVSQSTTQGLTSASESEDEPPAKSAGYEQTSQRNEELVRMAFAGDDVFQAFADEKKTTMIEEDDQVVDSSLPGWGSWTGAGISKKEQRRANSRRTTTTIKGVEPRKRKDAKLDRVIVNEKRSKKVEDHSVWKGEMCADEISRTPNIWHLSFRIHSSRGSNTNDLCVYR
jgi:U3 small nucleolar RNA-associated protein 14